ncbi:MAG TPA: histidinol dehydrogenase [Marinilabiliales bacterium]|nr:MAG: histidinol dehydrogenase [Bacteroidetes bacterium GWA2_40_14]OFX71574.1 MAG: histidinol dehydrogenase [Bacteroidetes bacterium GWD2_40_43]OFX95608.1 MAG: histidinol dehydrogenase [Bacteroidetes bacterium GWE2_40_63]OFY22233.1 MAG: histidinol dehydrogenase [Bacteroidetes bacterium GWF2_40_13]OFZ24872.1 MAG: histidinol dehydrogenase [Bacteroidetes bacterium RIFOXYC2_FULL_40_12]HAM98306.1 histidinol dehydrogenase [Marinilabiliales bacterium]
MEKYINPPKEQWKELLSRPVMDDSELFPIIQKIIQNVRNNGDKSLKEYALKFDNVELEQLLVTDDEFNEALLNIDTDLKMAIQQAAANIEKFHTEQLPRTIRIETMPGVECWQKSVPIQKVGLYIPGGTAPLFSTVLMLAIPARVAQCPEIVLCSPSDKDGKIHKAILFAARLCGINQIYKVGGAQAIAAMAYGTETIPKVDKIFGPGNQYVTAAKQWISSLGIAIDMPAGPSEVMVVVDETTPAPFAAADLLSQAEHGTDSQVMLLSNSVNKLEEIEKEVEQQLETLPRKEIASKALANSRFICLENFEQSIRFMNEYAPEHLILLVKEPKRFADRVTQAGSVFIGYYTPESAGDYASGTNHTLPTNGFARAYSGVNMDSFMKKITFQQISPQGLKNIGKTIEIMAENEQLLAHKNAVTIRLQELNTNDKK